MSTGTGAPSSTWWRVAAARRLTCRFVPQLQADGYRDDLLDARPDDPLPPTYAKDETPTRQRFH